MNHDQKPAIYQVDLDANERKKSKSRQVAEVHPSKTIEEHTYPACSVQRKSTTHMIWPPKNVEDIEVINIQPIKALENSKLRNRSHTEAWLRMTQTFYAVRRR